MGWFSNKKKRIADLERQIAILRQAIKIYNGELKARPNDEGIKKQLTEADDQITVCKDEITELKQ